MPDCRIGWHEPAILEPRTEEDGWHTESGEDIFITDAGGVKGDELAEAG